VHSSLINAEPGRVRLKRTDRKPAIPNLDLSSSSTTKEIETMPKRLTFVLAILATVPTAALAGSNSIGTASARGDMRVDSYKVQGNATLFDGSVVRTTDASVDLRMPRGVQIMLSTDSQGKLYRDHMELQSGVGVMISSNSFPMEAKGLRVTSTSPSSRGIVSLRTADNVEVSALSGSFGVTNAQGVLLANVIPGKALRFAAAQDAGASASVQVTGTITKTGGHYFITDSTTGKMYQLTGKGLSKYAASGKTVTVTSLVSGQTPLAGSGAIAVLANPAIALVSGAAVAGGLSTVATVLIVGGVVTAGTVGGLAVAGTFGYASP